MKKNFDLVFAIIVTIILTLYISSSPTKVIDGGNPWSNQFNNGFGCQTEDITNMYSQYVEEWKKQIGNAFDEAEVKVYNITPIPDVVGPDEDPAKCVCKGTGVIRHGDGHTTPCPYHGSKFNKPLIILEK